MKEIFQMSAKTFYGFEDILCEELKKIEAIDVFKSNRIVHFKGNKEIMYKANLCLRTALKILVPIAKRKVLNYESLYKFSFDVELAPPIILWAMLTLSGIAYWNCDGIDKIDEDSIISND